jgi:two-component system chemotaxis response regulator CheY
MEGKIMNKHQTVLIADDSTFMRTYLKRLLESNGYRVITESSNGQQAVELFEAYSPDITILDITMENLSGIEALKAIKAYDQQAKVIMLSSLGQKSFIEEAKSLGATDFVVKPNFDQLIPALRKLD